MIVAAALALLPLAVRSFRNTAPFVLFAVPAASRLLGRDADVGALLARILRRRPRPASPDHVRLNLALLGVTAAAAIAIVAAAFRAGDARLNWRPIGDGALAAARACEGPLYNHYDDGGVLIWFLPEKPVFIDGAPGSRTRCRSCSSSRRSRPGRRPTARCSIASTSAAPSFLAESVTVRGWHATGWTTRFRDDK